MKKKISDIKSFRKTVNRPLILDGAVGSLLQQQGINDKDLWTSRANITEQKKVKSVHKLYVEAGADIITTNTFRTNPIAFKSAKLDYNYAEFIKQSVNLAADVIGNKNVFIAASNSPAEDCYQTERTLSSKSLIENHHKHITELWNTGKVDFILNETFGFYDEIKIVCEFCHCNKIPFIISLFTKNGETILSGEPISEVTKFIKTFEPMAVSFNCIFPETFEKIYFSLDLDCENSFYLNCGSGNFEDEDIECGISPEKYLEVIKPFANENTLFVGSCCGSTPEHTKLLRNYFDKQN
ncbi:MAG: homocysteine S-methyltransferase family protein [Rhodothermaceae bacterium]